MKIVVTRPAEDAGPLAAKLEAMGHRAVLLPLLRIRARRPQDIPPLPYQAAIATSANAIRTLADPGALASLRMLTVGPQSLAAARAAGFVSAEAHGGDLAGLSDFIRTALRPADGPLLYLSGSETAGDLKALLESQGFACVRAVVYDAEPAAAAGPAGDALRRGDADAALLYSPRSARIWCRVMAAESLMAAAARLRYLCLSQNVAAALPAQWSTEVAKSPDEAAMLSLLAPESRNR